MLTTTMGKMMEALAPSSIHLLTPSTPKHTHGLANDVYTQMRTEFMVAAPFVLHGEVPELLAAAWCIVRETLFTGEADRGHKEIIAWAVSQSNECPFCVGAHLAAVKAAGANDEQLENWARNSFSSTEATELPQQFSNYSEEYIGTLLAFHYLNRMVSVFVDNKMMPLPTALDPVTNSMAKVMMGGLIKKGANNPQGTSTVLLPEINETLSWKPDWANGNEHVAAAIAGWSATIESVARQKIRVSFLEQLNQMIDQWQGGHQTRANIPFKDLHPTINDNEHRAAELALLTVMAPHLVKGADIESVLNSGWSKESTLSLVAWSAHKAARRCVEWTMKLN